MRRVGPRVFNTRIAATVRAAVMKGPGVLEVERFPLPEPEPGAVLLEVRYSGVCGTDKHTFRGETRQYAGTAHERDAAYPLICGHENVGVIAAIGGADAIRDSEGRPLRVGDRIVPAPNVPCGACEACRTGRPYYLCERLEDYGNSLSCAEPPHLFGGWAEYMYLLPGTPLFRVPDELPDEVAVLTEVMAVTHGLDKARGLLVALGGAGFGETVAVLGVGPLGLCHVLKARLLGCGELIALDRLPSRVEKAARLGATLGIAVEETDEGEERLARIAEHTGGRGPDIVVDCTGVPGPFAEALQMVRPGGVVVEAGAFVDLGPVPVNPNLICAKNVAVIGVGGETATAYAPTMRLLAASLDRFPLGEVVTHRFALERAREALEVSQTDAAMKVVLDPAA